MRQHCKGHTVTCTLSFPIVCTPVRYLRHTPDWYGQAQKAGRLSEQKSLYIREQCRQELLWPSAKCYKGLRWRTQPSTRGHPPHLVCDERQVHTSDGCGGGSDLPACCCRELDLLWCARSGASWPLKPPGRPGSACLCRGGAGWDCCWTADVATAVMLNAGALCMAEQVRP